MRINPINTVNSYSKSLRSEKPKSISKGLEPEVNFKGHIKNIYRDGNFGRNPISEARCLFDRLWRRAAQYGSVYNSEAAKLLEPQSKIILLEDKLARFKRMGVDNESRIVGNVVAYSDGVKFCSDDITFSVDGRRRLVIQEPYDMLCFHDNGMIRKYEHYSSDYCDSTVDRYDKDGNMTFWSLFDI